MFFSHLDSFFLFFFHYEIFPKHLRAIINYTATVIFYSIIDPFRAMIILLGYLGLCV